MICGILLVCTVIVVIGAIILYERHCNKPIYRIDVLRYANEHRDIGLCFTIYHALVHFNINTKDIGMCKSVRYYFPEFTIENAEPFGASNDTYWWAPYTWKQRAEFLNWLIKFYENDKTDLRTYKKDEND